MFFAEATLGCLRDFFWLRQREVASAIFLAAAALGCLRDFFWLRRRWCELLLAVPRLQC